MYTDFNHFSPLEHAIYMRHKSTMTPATWPLFCNHPT